MRKILYSVSPAGVKEFLDGDGHFGQIVLLRRVQGLWPPQGGDANDF